VSQWWHDPNFSHGFFVPGFSLLILWRDRFRLRSTPNVPSGWGILVVVFALSLLALGIMGAELFLSRISLLVLIAGLVVCLWGWKRLWAVVFPLAFLLLMIPIPYLIFSQITFPLQIVASKLAALLLPLAGVPVLREGNIINLSSMSLEVAQACSGIRSLLSLITLAIMYGYLVETDNRVRCGLVFISVPIAVVANSLRIVGTGLVVQFWNPDKAEGFFHAFSGWLIFLVAFGSLLFFHQVVYARWWHRQALS
jgi:exosortase